MVPRDVLPSSSITCVYIHKSSRLNRVYLQKWDLFGLPVPRNKEGNKIALCHLVKYLLAITDVLLCCLRSNKLINLLYYVFLPSPFSGWFFPISARYWFTFSISRNICTKRKNPNFIYGLNGEGSDSPPDLFIYSRQPLDRISRCIGIIKVFLFGTRRIYIFVAVVRVETQIIASSKI